MMTGLDLKLVQGPIHSLDKAKSKIAVNQNIGGIAAGTAFAGVLAESSSLLTSAPILVMAGKAKDGITFTTVRFKENDELIAIINDSPVDGRYQVYAIVDPKLGLLYMIYQMGRSVKKGYKAIVMQTYYFTLICWGGLSIILLVLYVFDSNYSWGSFFDLISWIFIFLILAFLFMGFINYFAYRKSYENFGNLSEKIFENPKEQDFYYVRKNSFFALNRDLILQKLMNKTQMIHIWPKTIL